MPFLHALGKPIRGTMGYEIVDHRVLLSYLTLSCLSQSDRQISYDVVAVQVCFLLMKSATP